MKKFKSPKSWIVRPGFAIRVVAGVNREFSTWPTLLWVTAIIKRSQPNIVLRDLRVCE